MDIRGSISKYKQGNSGNSKRKKCGGVRRDWSVHFHMQSLMAKGDSQKRVLMRWMKYGTNIERRYFLGRSCSYNKSRRLQWKKRYSFSKAVTSREPRAGFPLSYRLGTHDLPRTSWVKVGQIITLSTERSGKNRHCRLRRTEVYYWKPDRHYRLETNSQSTSVRVKLTVRLRKQSQPFREEQRKSCRIAIP